MPSLIESLQGRDLGFLHIIAGMWGISLADQDVQTAIRSLNTSILDARQVTRLVSSLPPDAKGALDELIRNAGRMPWAQFTRKFGEVREIGAARRDRERPYENPISAAEVLWYRALVAKAFYDTPRGPQEFAFIPDNFIELLSKTEDSEKPIIGRPASTAEYTQKNLSTDCILDHSCTALAALRMGFSLPEAYINSAGEKLSTAFMLSLLSAENLIDDVGLPNSEAVRKFLGVKRGKALAQLFTTWQESKSINELRLLSDLIIEGNWANDPLRARRTIIAYLCNLPESTWWNLRSFVSGIKQHDPDFQRPAGDYDSWFIRDKASGAYLRGFDHWDEVEGRLVTYVVTGPLHWLGILDIACLEGGEQATAFRLSGWAKALLHGEPPDGMPGEDGKLIIRSDARLSARKLVPRHVRYQVARFCDWQADTPDEYQYQISSASLSRARQQGLKVSQLQALLDRNAKAVPPSLSRALERWDKQGCEARLERMVVLRVTSVEILQALRKSRASRFLSETLGPTTIAVKPGAVDRVLGALAELGYLGEIRGEVEQD
jgi:hypothetical protein